MWRWVSIEPPHLEVSHLWRSESIAPSHLSNRDVASLEVNFGKQIIVSASIGYLSTEPFTYAIYIVIAIMLEVHLSNRDVASLEVNFGKQIIVSASIGYLSTEPFTYAIYIVIAIMLEVYYLAITLLLVLLNIGCWCT